MFPHRMWEYSLWEYSMSEYSMWECRMKGNCATGGRSQKCKFTKSGKFKALLYGPTLLTQSVTSECS